MKTRENQMGREIVVEALRPFGTSIFTEMSVLANTHGAVNLSQGFPDFDGPREIRAMAADAILRGPNQYVLSSTAKTFSMTGWKVGYVIAAPELSRAVRMLPEKAGVAAIPCSCFWNNRSRGRELVRFCFCKKDETLDEAIKRLKRWLR